MFRISVRYWLEKKVTGSEIEFSYITCFLAFNDSFILGVVKYSTNDHHHLHSCKSQKEKGFSQDSISIPKKDFEEPCCIGTSSDPICVLRRKWGSLRQEGVLRSASLKLHKIQFLNDTGKERNPTDV